MWNSLVYPLVCEFIRKFLAEAIFFNVSSFIKHGMKIVKIFEGQKKILVNSFLHNHETKKQA